MEASEQTISKILVEQMRYEIPPYQRPYSWEKSNVEQLLEDVLEAYEANDEEYFIGSLITIEKTKNELYEVVDGQQRITTLNLIFARLRDHIDDDYAKGELGKRVMPRNPLTGEAEAPRLMLRDRDQSFFRRHALESVPVTDAILREIERDQDAPKLRIAENLATIDAFCASKNQQTLKLFANYLLTNVYVVFVTTASWKSAYRLFNVLNARGMPLTNADLIKNMLFARLKSGQGSEDLEERWLELEDTIGIEQMDQFLGHHRSSVVATKSRKSLQEEFEPLIDASDGPFAFIDEVTKSAKNFVRILQVAFDDPAAKRALRSLHRVTFEEWVPPLLAFLNQPTKDISERDFICLLEKITFQNWVRRLAFTARLTVYFQLINAIKAGKKAGELTAIFQSHAQNEEFKSLLGANIYGKPFARAVLLRLEEAAQDHSVTKDYGGKITIEHVLPQALKDEYWKDRYTDEQHSDWVHRLGNLALLAGTKNYKAQYFSFDRKKTIYEKKNDVVSFDTTKQILSEDDWGLEQISARQDMLVDSAIRVWAIE